MAFDCGWVSGVFFILFCLFVIRFCGFWHGGLGVDGKGGRWVVWFFLDGCCYVGSFDRGLLVGIGFNIMFSLRRHQSPIIPVRCGPEAETFYVHKDILTKSEFFRNALDGRFREADEQAVDLPEEDPALFSFVVAYLYEGKFSPIKPAVDALGEFLRSGGVSIC